VLGAPEPECDVEVICVAADILDRLGVLSRCALKLNSLGDPESRAAYRKVLIDYYRGHQSTLSEDSLRRLERNPLRILDSKDAKDRAVCADAPAVDDYLTSEASEFFAAVVAGIDAAGVPWKRNARLVRGLDYYRHTAFEFVTDRLGAQGTVIAGGRYDGLIEALGGPHTPAVGWAAGIERLAMMIDAPGADRASVVVIPLGDRAEAEAQRIVAGLRREGIAAEMAYRGNMKKRLARANASGAAFALIIGDDELDRGEAQLKDLTSGEQRSVSLDLLAEAIGR
jgi:histidyl-tRNA synthetase